MEISVVIPSYNEAKTIDKTLESVCNNQLAVDEIIIVNDGSTDQSHSILNAWQDSQANITVIHQENSGISQALITGCEAATGDYIARQDMGDYSLVKRFESQLSLLQSSIDASLCSTGTRFLSEKREFLYEVNQSSEEADGGLKTTSFEKLSGPSHHGATMFRRDAYIAVGGYRHQFKVAQDLDLWCRLSEVGRHITTSRVGYEAILRPQAISTQKRKLQERCRELIWECTQARRADLDDTDFLAKAKELAKQEGSSPLSDKESKMEYNYFVGSVLLANRDPRHRDYFKQLLPVAPWNPKIWLKLIRSYL